MNAENLVSKEKLLVIIKKLGKAPWGLWDKEGGTMNNFIPYDAVMSAIKSPAQGVSPAELAEILKEKLKGDSRVLGKLNEWIILEKQKLKGEAPNSRHWLGLFELHIQNLEAQAPVSELTPSEENRRKAEAWDKLYLFMLSSRMDELLAQSKVEPKAEEEKR